MVCPEKRIAQVWIASRIKALPAISGRNEDTADAGRLAARLPDPCIARRLAGNKKAQVKCIGVLAVQLRIEASLFEDENVDAQLQERIKLDGGECFQPPHIDGVGTVDAQ